MGIAGFGVGLLLTHYGYVADQEQTPYAMKGIALMLCIFPGIFHAGMGLIMFFFKITDQYYNDLKAGKIPGLKPISELQHTEDTLAHPDHPESF